MISGNSAGASTRMSKSIEALNMNFQNKKQQGYPSYWIKLAFHIRHRVSLSQVRILRSKTRRT